MPANNTLIEDMMKLSGNVLGNLLGARHEMKAQTKQKIDSVMRQLNLVSREEFDAAFAMLAKARMMQEELAERLAAVEAKLPVSSGTKLKSKSKRRSQSLRKSNYSRK